MIVVNAQHQPLATEVIVDLVRRVLAERGVADDGLYQVCPVSGLAGACQALTEELTEALSQWDLPPGRQVVLIPPDDAQVTLSLAAALYRQTGVFPVIARLTHCV